ncbi:MAG: exo-alpha-sialidase [Bryobacterales bacterium]|nr:exo-alpha-sialidase [Bryobacterales bacterium]
MIKRCALLLCSMTMLFAAESRRSDLFQSGTGGYALYRIPGIVVTAKGTLLAYAEARKSDRGDWGPIDIVLRRSTDGGATWSAAKVIAKVEGEHRKNPVALAQSLANPSDVTYNNPVAIADRKTGAVHFLFCQEYMRAFYMRSDDDGQSFGKPVEITATFDRFRPEYNWKVLATGPGHGIQLSGGRLLVPVWLSTGTGGHAHRPSVTSTIYSDDAGRSWQRGAIAVPDTPEWVFPNETAAAELSDGRVLLNVRTESKGNRRLLTTSGDGATGWSAPQFHENLLEPICFGSMATLAVDGKSRLLFSNPDNLEKTGGVAEPGKNRDRKNLAIQVSYDDARTWMVKKVIEPGWAGYSDLATDAKGWIYCFFERGGIGDNHFKTAALTLVRMDVEWLTDGKDSLKRK